MTARENITWHRPNGTTRLEGSSQNYGPYIIEGEFNVWWGGVRIGAADTIHEAKAIALAHCRSF